MSAMCVFQLSEDLGFVIVGKGGIRVCVHLGLGGFLVSRVAL